MKLEDLLKQQEFLEILDKESPEDMIKYLNDNLFINEYARVANMFKELGIFQNVAIYDANPNEKYKYIAYGAFNNRTSDAGTIIDTRGSTIFYKGLWNPADCEIILDDTTTICRDGIIIMPNNDADKYTLTFLGIPKFEELCGIHISASLKQVKVKAKADIANEVKELFRQLYIQANREAFRYRIEVI